MWPLRSAFLPGKPARVEAAQQQQQQASADRSTASAVLAAGVGTARLLAKAGSCLAHWFAQADAEAIGLELLRRPRGRATQARQDPYVCLYLSLFRVYNTRTAERCKKMNKHGASRHDPHETRAW